MGKNKGLIEKVKKIENERKISLETPLKTFVQEVGYKSRRNPNGMSHRLYETFREIGKYVDTIGDLKKLAEVGGGLKEIEGVVFYKEGNKHRIRYGLKGFGKSKLDEFNRFLSAYGIEEEIPWKTIKFKPWGKYGKYKSGDVEGVSCKNTRERILKI